MMDETMEKKQPQNRIIYLINGQFMLNSTIKKIIKKKRSV